MDERDERAAALGVNLVLEAVGAEVAEAFWAAGLAAVLLKGPVLVRWLYGSDAARSSTDVDILVDPAAVGRAEEVLRDLGFGRAATGIGDADRPRHASTWIRRPGEPAVDLHTTLVGVEASPAEAWTVLRERTETASVGGTDVEVPAPDARLLQVALHAAQHGKRKPQPLQDLSRALQVATRAQWNDAASLARRLCAEEALAAGLDLLEGGRTLRDELRLPTPGTVETALRATTAPALALGLDWLVRAPGIRPRARFVLGKTFPPAAFMRAWTPLARRGPAGLALAYMWRPVWLVVHGGRAVRAWSRARRSANPS